MAQIVPIVVGDLSPEVGRIVLSLMNFMFRAHASCLTEADLATFHRLKDVTIAKGLYESSARFDVILKLHMLRHHAGTVRQLGTPAGFNTEAPEHLHIEYAKIPWCESNKVKLLPQMVRYIQREDHTNTSRSHERGLGARQR
jgi:hypothetical protein